VIVRPNDAKAAHGLARECNEFAARLAHDHRGRFGVFGTTAIAFFLAEMGDKTQIATVALAAHYNNLVAVVAGTTLGILLADVPVVFIGDRLARKVPMRLVHGIAAALFALLGAATLLNLGRFF